MQPLPELCRSLVVLCSPFCLLNFTLHFYYWVFEWKFGLPLRRHAQREFADGMSLKCSCSHRPHHYTHSTGWWQQLEGSRFIYVPTTPVFTCYSDSILKHYLCQDFVWRIATLEFAVCTFISLHEFACTGANVLFSGDSGVLNVNKGIRGSIPLPLCHLVEQ